MSATHRHDRSAGSGPGGRAFLASRKGLGAVPGSTVICGLLAALLASFLTMTLASGVAVAATRAGHTIASAKILSLGKKTSGGGGRIDFWKVPLLGGDQVQFLVKTPNPGGGCCGTYHFELYQPGTTDANFPQRAPVFATVTPEGSTSSVLVLQAPYNGTFVLAVCQNVSGDCRNVDSGGGTNPMASYTFTATFVHAVNPKVGAKETRATTTIAKAVVTPVGHFESGGGNGIDFWKVPLLGGDQVQLSVQTPYPGGGCCGTYHFELYQPGTNDTNFPQRAPVFATVTPEGSTSSVLVLQAPYNATFVLAVCQNVSGDCRNVDSGGGTNPMSPYTFTPTFIHAVNPKVGAKETRATTTIAKAATMPVGNYEAGGGNGIDFWKVHLAGGSRVQISTQTPYPGGGCCGTYHFELYKPGTTDTNFPQRAPVAAAVTPEGSTKSTLSLKAPATGTFIFAVCQNVSVDCRDVDSGGGSNPMGTYTFTPTLVK